MENVLINIEMFLWFKKLGSSAMRRCNDPIYSNRCKKIYGLKRKGDLGKVWKGTERGGEEKGHGERRWETQRLCEKGSGKASVTSRGKGRNSLGV